MRMWMVDPKKMCLQHLLGEHGEIHKHRHNFVKKHRISGRIAGNAVEPKAMEARHDELEEEIRRRAIESGRKPPSSPYELPPLDHLSDEERGFKIDRTKAFMLLHERCPNCRERMRDS